MSSTPQPVEGAVNAVNMISIKTQAYGTGRRKESVARVFLKVGSGKFEVNGRPVAEYFRNIAWLNARY